MAEPMPALKSWLVDRFRLVIAATVTLAVMIAVVALIERTGLRDPWGLFLFQTILFPPIIIYQARRLFRERGRPFRRRWPMMAVSIGAFAAHCVVLGFAIYWFQPDWRGPHWMVIDGIELSAIGIAVEMAYEYSTIDRPFDVIVRGYPRQL